MEEKEGKEMGEENLQRTELRNGKCAAAVPVPSMCSEGRRDKETEKGKPPPSSQNAQTSHPHAKKKSKK